MNKKIEALYVASRVAHLEYETNPWIQYESFGEVEHRIYVSPKKELIYSVIEDGITKYYLYPSHQEIEESTFKSSYKTNSDAFTSIYSAALYHGKSSTITGLNEKIKAEYEKKTSLIGYLIPITTYLGISDKTPLKLAYALVRLSNIKKSNKPMLLSFEEQEAEKQLQEIGYIKEKETTKKLVLK